MVVQEPTKTLVDNSMRLQLPHVPAILSKVLGPKAAQFPELSPELKYGTLSTPIHSPKFKAIYIRDDDPEEVNRFFLTLAAKYHLVTEQLDGDMIAAFEHPPSTL